MLLGQLLELYEHHRHYDFYAHAVKFLHNIGPEINSDNAVIHQVAIFKYPRMNAFT